MDKDEDNNNKNNNKDMHNNNVSKNSDDKNSTNQSTIKSTKENVRNAKRMREEDEEEKEVATPPAKFSKKNPPPLASKEDPALLLSKKAPPPGSSKKDPPSVESGSSDNGSTDEGSGQSFLRAVDTMRCNIKEYRMRHSQVHSNFPQPRSDHEFHSPSEHNDPFLRALSRTQQHFYEHHIQEQQDDDGSSQHPGVTKDNNNKKKKNVTTPKSDKESDLSSSTAMAPTTTSPSSSKPSASSYVAHMPVSKEKPDDSELVDGFFKPILQNLTKEDRIQYKKTLETIGEDARKMSGKDINAVNNPPSEEETGISRDLALEMALVFRGLLLKFFGAKTVQELGVEESEANEDDMGHLRVSDSIVTAKVFWQIFASQIGYYLYYANLAMNSLEQSNEEEIKEEEKDGDDDINGGWDD